MGKSLEHILYKEKIQMGNKHRKICFISLEIREMKTIEMPTKWNPEILLHIHTPEWKEKIRFSNIKW